MVLGSSNQAGSFEHFNKSTRLLCYHWPKKSQNFSGIYSALLSSGTIGEPLMLMQTIFTVISISFFGSVTNVYADSSPALVEVKSRSAQLQVNDVTILPTTKFEVSAGGSTDIALIKGHLDLLLDVTGDVCAPSKSALVKSFSSLIDFDVAAKTIDLSVLSVVPGTYPSNQESTKSCYFSEKLSVSIEIAGADAPYEVMRTVKILSTPRLNMYGLIIRPDPTMGPDLKALVQLQYNKEAGTVNTTLTKIGQRD